MRIFIEQLFSVILRRQAYLEQFFFQTEYPWMKLSHIIFLLALLIGLA